VKILRTDNLNMSNYVIAPEARDDLFSILDYIANDSINSALKVHSRFLEIFNLLAENPDIGHYRKDLTSRPVLSCLFLLGHILGRH